MDQEYNSYKEIKRQITGKWRILVPTNLKIDYKVMYIVMKNNYNHGLMHP